MKVVACLIALCLVTQIGVANAADPPRPNVIYFLVDDLGRNDCGFMGSKEIRTPNIDKLAAAGATLDAYYVQPLCSPTRAALLTGRYPMRYGLQVGVVKPWAQYGLPLEEKTLGDDLQAAGYATGIFGKWHLGFFKPDYLPTRRGFGRQYGHYNGALDYFTHMRDGGFDWHKNDQVNHDEGYSTDLVGKNAAEFVAEHGGNKPFFLYVPFNGVHSPYQPPKGGADEYRNLKGVRRQYAAMTTSVDHAIGEIVAAVDKAGQRENTLFIFSSDNGGPAPGRITDNGAYRGGKGGLYEGGVRVAAFATWAGRIPAGTTNKQPMHAVDWRPTLHELCGAKPSNEQALDGLNVWETLSGEAPSPHKAILLNASPNASALRVGDWKLISRQEGKRGRKLKEELYNLVDDPRETTNLAETKPEKTAELRKILADFGAQAVPPKAGAKPKDFKVPAVWGEAG